MFQVIRIKKEAAGPRHNDFRKPAASMKEHTMGGLTSRPGLVSVSFATMGSSGHGKTFHKTPPKVVG